MLDFLRQAVEYQKWGYNVATFGAIAVAILTFVELYALAVQGRAVWRQRSGQSLNALPVAYIAFISFATATYGFQIKSITLIWNGLSAGLLGALVLWGLYKFKKFSWVERFLVPMFALMPIAMFWPQRQLLYAIFPLGLVFTTGMQLGELVTNRDRGVVELRFLVAYAAISGSWIVFGVAIGDWAIWAVQVLLHALLLTTIAAWLRLPRSAA